MTLNPIYQPTLLQKLLGRNYKWWYVTKFSLKSETDGLTGFLWGYLASIISMLAIIYVWYVAKSNSDVFTYLLIGNIFSTIFNNVYFYRISSMIFTGSITTQLILPTDFFLNQFFRSLGTRIFKNILLLGGNLIAILIALTFVKLDFPKLEFLYYFLVLGFLSFTIQQFLGLIIGSTAFWFKNMYRFDALRSSYDNLQKILAGYAIPLFILPFSLGNYIQFLPFSYFLHHPMQIYLGKYDTVQTIWVFVGGIAWCIILFFLAKLVFKLGLKRNESVGL